MSTRSFTVGWICALQEEYDVACRMLDEEVDDLEDNDLDPTDNNAYTFGTIGNHRVVIGCLPEGRYGTTSAARVVRDISRSFPNVRFCLMVGIGGGAPSGENDIRLGDVVVSVPNKTCSGVVQYDFGKRLPAGGFVQTGQLNAPPEALLGAIRKIRRLYNDPIKPDRIAEHIKRMDDCHPSYVRPAEDHLYRSNYHHNGGYRNCNACNKDMLVSRPDRQLSGRHTWVHYGTIASGNSVIKDAQFRDRYAKDPSTNVLCFEMEAAGLMNDVPCLVIRGICDYSDSHKNDDWHRYAALTAAAYAREVLLVLRPRQVDAMPAWAEKINQIAREVIEVKSLVVGTNKVFESLREDSHVNAIRSWLAPPDSSINLAKAKATRYAGTGLWFLENDTFQKWELGKCRYLWLRGIPGSGKTVLTSSIIEYLYRQQEINQSKHILLTFYFDFTDSSKRSFDQLLRSLMMQLYYQSSNARSALKHFYYNMHDGQRQLEISSLAETFLTMSRKADEHIRIVIDALDECRNRKDLLLWIKEIIASHGDQGIQLLVSSRMEADIEFAFSTASLGDHDILIAQSLTNADIKAYIHGTLRGENEFKRWSSNPDILNEIEVELIKKAGGMFRWVSCQLDVLQKCVHLRALRKALASLPATLDETYARILKSISSEYRDDAIKLLQFLCFSERPLTIAEAVDAIAVNITDEDSYFDFKERMPRPHDIARICSSLLSITPRISSEPGNSETTTIQLAHSSVKEYLMSDLVESNFRNHLGELQARATIVKMLLDAGAQWEARDPFGALKVACDTRNAGIVEMLLEKEEESVKWARDAFQILSDNFSHFDLKNMAKILCGKRWPRIMYVDAARYRSPNQPDWRIDDHDLLVSLLPPLTSGSKVIEVGYRTWEVDVLRTQESSSFTLRNNSKHVWKIKLDYIAGLTGLCSLYLAPASRSSGALEPIFEGPVEFAFVMWKVDKPSRFIARGTLNLSSSKHYFHVKENDWGFRQLCPQSRLIETLGGGLSSALTKVNITVYLRLLNVTGSGYRPIGLKNQGTTGWLNVILQLVYHIKILRKTIYGIPTGRQHKNDIAWALQRLFHSMQTSKDAVSTRELTDAFGWGPKDLLPQDAQIWQRTFHKKLGTRLDGQPLKHVVQNLLVGQTNSYTSAFSSISWTQESFWELQLDIRTFRSLNDCLRQYVQPRSLAANISTGKMFEKFPLVLNLHLKRYELEPAAPRGYGKVSDSFQFPEEIDLGPFMNTDDTTGSSEPWVYRLMSVVVHEGSYEEGVYYAYVRPEKNEGFFRIHDEHVTPVTVSEVFQAGYGGDGCGSSQRWSKCATILCYCRKSRLEEAFVDITDDDIPDFVFD